MKRPQNLKKSPRPRAQAPSRVIRHCVFELRDRLLDSGAVRHSEHGRVNHANDGFCGHRSCDRDFCAVTGEAPPCAAALDAMRVATGVAGYVMHCACAQSAYVNGDNAARAVR